MVAIPKKDRFDPIPPKTAADPSRLDRQVQAGVKDEEPTPFFNHHHDNNQISNVGNPTVLPTTSADTLPSPRLPRPEEVPNRLNDARVDPLMLEWVEEVQRNTEAIASGPLAQSACPAPVLYFHTKGVVMQNLDTLFRHIIPDHWIWATVGLRVIQALLATTLRIAAERDKPDFDVDFGQWYGMARPFPGPSLRLLAQLIQRDLRGGGFSEIRIEYDLVISWDCTGADEVRISGRFTFDGVWSHKPFFHDILQIVVNRW